MPILTIYTATYNREILLHRIYKSLLRQTCKNFLWMVIDDGSTDHTKEVVENWMRQNNGFEIVYHYKRNEGIHTVRDMAYYLCETELIAGVDSDDWLVENAVKNIVSCWNKRGGMKYAGIITPAIYENGEMVCRNFPRVEQATFQEFAYKYCCRGDKETILRTDIIKKIPNAPVFEGEKLIGEGYKWIQLPQDKPFLILCTPFLVKEYQNDGYTKEAHSGILKNPNGFRVYYSQHIINAKYLKPRLKGYLGYIICSFILKDWKFIQKSPKPFKTLLLVPFGIMGYFYLRIKSSIINSERNG